MKLDEEFTLEGRQYDRILKYEKDTGETTDGGKPIISKDKWYAAKLSQILNRYLEEAVKPAQSVKDLALKLDEIQETIEKLRTA